MIRVAVLERPEKIGDMWKITATTMTDINVGEIFDSTLIIRFLGDAFSDDLKSEEVDRQPVSLEIKNIHYYRHEFETLGKGMGCHILASGNADNLVEAWKRKAGDVLIGLVGSGDRS